MADLSERTEAPTPRRLRRARERGEVAKSPLASAALVWLGFTACAAFGAEAALGAFRGLVLELWRPGALPGASEALARSADVAAAVAGPPLALAVALGALGSFLQVGPLLTAAPLAPDLTRLDPARGLARAFSWHSMAERLAGLPLGVLLVGIAWMTLRSALPGLLGRTAMTPAALASAGESVLLTTMWRTSGALALAGAAAYAYRRWRYLEDHRMSRRELREEQRETEGEPTARRRRARTHRERALGPTIPSAVAEAVAIVHGAGVAVAIGWDGEGAPRVLFVGRGLAARALLAARGPVDAPHDAVLAAALARVEPGPVPRALYRALALHLARGRSSPNGAGA